MKRINDLVIQRLTMNTLNRAKRATCIMLNKPKDKVRI